MRFCYHLFEDLDIKLKKEIMLSLCDIDWLLDISFMESEDDTKYKKVTDMIMYY